MNLIGVERCCRCFIPLEDDEAHYVDIYGGPVCKACHEAEWGESLEEE